MTTREPVGPGCTASCPKPSAKTRTTGRENAMQMPGIRRTCPCLDDSRPGRCRRGRGHAIQRQAKTMQKKMPSTSVPLESGKHAPGMSARQRTHEAQHDAMAAVNCNSMFPTGASTMPKTSAMTPRHSAAVIRGAAMRFATGEMRGSWANCATVTGSVRHDAASVAAIEEDTNSGRRGRAWASQ